MRVNNWSRNGRFSLRGEDFKECVVMRRENSAVYGVYTRETFFKDLRPNVWNFLYNILRPDLDIT